ncbi:50S ribosomal protein L17 [Leptospirillum ferrooxidans]|uniref:Large ribosomal subunit protein bL17 n=1 Tax=Leptospirillum ferrooxidans (strain C2-3) TaxID=1162668 RepID=I0IMW5_LEPFC|nr:50S ribosomal protein L17 [Leptospirillum ferrooxidans]BAM06614.1 ribosomal protein L17 [Leptospirillum ferrooxidans C2-3]
MRHRLQGRQFGRDSNHRQAMFRSLITAFFEHERIETTHMKAKELRPMIEKMISKARVKSVTTLRSLLKVIRDKDVAFHLLDEVAPRFISRPGGYTRIVKTRRRIGDGAEMAIIELVELGQSLSDKRSKSKTSPPKPKSPSTPTTEAKESSAV